MENRNSKEEDEHDDDEVEDNTQEIRDQLIRRFFFPKEISFELWNFHSGREREPKGDDDDDEGKK